MNTFKQSILSNSGMTLIEVMVSVAISTIVILASTSMGQMALNTQSQNNISFQADIIRRNLIAILTSDTAWKNTANSAVNNAGSLKMNCITDPSPPGCNPHKNTQFSFTEIRDANDHPVYNFSTNPGFYADGTLCDGTHGSCPITFDLHWTAICTSVADCVGPQVKIDIAANFNLPANSSIVINKANYGATIYR